MTPDYTYVATVHGCEYRGDLFYGAAEILESVEENGILVWETVFPRRNINGASPQEYLKVMTESIADRRKRDKYPTECYYAPLPEENGHGQAT